jgi:hemoglobin-like flavoprotein
MQQSAHQIAQQSYSRCLRSPDFLPRFYEHLLASDPAIPPMFAETQFPRQYRLLQHALGLLLSYGNRPDEMLLERLAAKHSAKSIDVRPSLYALFVESLLVAIREFDDGCDGDVEGAWREALRPGIDYMKSKYDA